MQILAILIYFSPVEEELPLLEQSSDEVESDEKICENVAVREESSILCQDNSFAADVFQEKDIIENMSEEIAELILDELICQIFENQCQIDNIENVYNIEQNNAELVKTEVINGYKSDILIQKNHCENSQVNISKNDKLIFYHEYFC